MNMPYTPPTLLPHRRVLFRPDQHLCGSLGNIDHVGLGGGMLGVPRSQPNWGPDGRGDEGGGEWIGLAGSGGGFLGNPESVWGVRGCGKAATLQDDYLMEGRVAEAGRS